MMRIEQGQKKASSEWHLRKSWESVSKIDIGLKSEESLTITLIHITIVYDLSDV